MLHVVGMAVGASIVSAVLVGTIAATEESCAPSRRAYVRFARGVLRQRMLRANGSGDVLTLEQCKNVLQDIRLLERNIAAGWNSQAEAAALGRVALCTTSGVAVNAGSDIVDSMFYLGDEIGKELGGLTADLKRVFASAFPKPNAPMAA